MNGRIEQDLGFGEHEIDDCVRGEGLLSLELEFTRKCNLRCIYCYSSAGDPPEGEVGLPLVLDAIRQARDLGARLIVLLGGGEPLLYLHAREVIEYIGSLGLRQAMFTNGALLTREWRDLLRARRVKVIVKRNSSDPYLQDYLAGIPGAYRSMARGLSLLMDSGFAAEGLLGVQTVICRQNMHEIEPMWVWARERGITPYFETITFQGRAREHLDLHPDPREVGALFDRLAEVDRDRFGIEWAPRPPIAAFTCRRHRYSCLVNSLGDVQPCTGIDLTVGNLRDARLADILRDSEVIRRLRRVHEHLDSACSTCPHDGECYGCRGNAFQTTGDYLSPDPSCWFLAQRRTPVPARPLEMKTGRCGSSSSR